MSATPTVEIEDIYGLSPLQHGMLFHSLLEPEAGLYFEQVVFRLPGAVDHGAVRNAWNDLAANHGVLRTSFFWEDLDNPVQVVHRGVEIPVVVLDWRGQSSGQQHAALQRFLAEDRTRGFDLAVAPLFRLALVRLAATRQLLVASFHHAILDGWSLNLVFAEFADHYGALRRGTRHRAAPVRPYRDYIEWVRTQDADAAERFWRRTLAGYTGPPHGWLDGDRRKGRGRFGEDRARLSATTTEQLRSLARTHRVTLGTVLYGAWSILLNRYLRDRDVVFGSIVSGRGLDLDGADRMVGLFINTVPVRAIVDPRLRVGTLLGRIQAQQTEARLYEHCPLVEVQGWSQVPHDRALFDTLLIFENHPMSGSPDRSGSGGTPRAVERTNYPLTLLAGPGTELSFTLIHDGAQVDPGRGRRLLAHLTALLASMADAGDAPIGSLSMLTAAERTAAATTWNRPVDAEAGQDRLEARFVARVASDRDGLAVVDGGRDWTFGGLDDRSRRIAHALLQRGVTEGDVVGLHLPRSADLVAAVLGVLRVGAAWLPLDPDQPPKRLSAMVADARAAAVVTTGTSADSGPVRAPSLIPLDRLPTEMVPAVPPRRDSRQSAYVVYTSGSTGEPKGIVQTHQATLNRLEWMWRHHPFAPDERCCLKTSPGFVDSVWELLGPLLAGVPTVVVPDEVLHDPRLVLEWLARHEVTRIVLVPSLLRALLEQIEASSPPPPALRVWSCSGEPLPADLVERFRRGVPGARLLNLYGSSEVAADVTVHEATTTAVGARTQIPIGLPIDNVTVHVLDDAMTPTPVDLVGEVWVGGLAVARGYLGRPGATAERFVPDPFRGAGERLYRTGDLAYRGEDGAIVFVGRADHQVKVRGARVELAEVEAALEQQPGVERAVATVTDGDEPDLVAHVTGTGGSDVDTSTLRRALETQLPGFLVPTTIVALATLPLLPNGKVDRHHLPVPQGPARQGEATSPPRSSVERSLAAIWSVVLHVEQPDLADDFFAMGGHSLLAMRLVARISKTLGVEVPLRVVFDTPTLGALAAHVETSLQEGGSGVAPIRRVDRTERVVEIPPAPIRGADVRGRNDDGTSTTTRSSETTTFGGDQR